MKRNVARGLAVAASCVSVLALSQPASAGFVASRAALGGTDFIDWGQLGPSFTTVPDPAAVTTNLGLSATVNNPTGSIVRRDQGSGWAGVFAPGARIIWTNGSAGPISIDFATPLSAVGAQIQQNQFGVFSGIISVFNASNALLETYTFPGPSSPAGDDSALFLGIMRAEGDIDRIEFSTGGGDFAINQFDLSIGRAPTGVPEPGALALLAAALGILGLSRRLRQGRAR